MSEYQIVVVHEPLVGPGENFPALKLDDEASAADAFDGQLPGDPPH